MTLMNCRLIALLLICGCTRVLMAADTAFTYHGKLTDNGTPPTAAYDFKFTLRERAPGVQSWGPLTKANVNVVAGEFDVMLDFGTDPFRGNDVQLEIAARVHPASGDPPYAILSPAVTLTAVPYAIAALNTAPNSITAQHIAPNQVVKSINGVAADAITFQAGSGVTIAPPTAGGTIVISAHGNSWSLNGNSGTTEGTDFLGTTDDKPIEFRVNGRRALRLEPAFFGANVIAGSDNQIINGTGAAISGGTDNRIEPGAHYASIPGGYQAVARSYGQFAVSTGQIQQKGDAQTSIYVLRGFTGSGELFLDRATERMNIPRGAVWIFRIQVAAVTDGDPTAYAAFDISGMVANMAGTAMKLQLRDGTGNSRTTAVPIFQSPGATEWSVQPWVDDATKTFQIRVQGTSGTKWVATVYATEVVQ